MSPTKPEAYRLANSVTRLARYAVILTAILYLFAGTSTAATYYVDFAAGSDANPGTKTQPWKRCPGMSGFAGSYTHSAGDVFVFKGGVTWTGIRVWTISNSGSSGNPDTYTTDHTWYAGTSWSQPTFDAQAGGQLFSTSSSYVTLNDLKFVNCGTAYVANSVKCLIFTNTHDITFSNNTVIGYSWIGVFFDFEDGGSHSNFTITGNDTSHVTGAVWFATATSGTTMHNLKYNGNTIHDFASQMGGGAHGDGFLHFFTDVGGNYADASTYLDGLEFCNNYSYGDFTRGISGSAPQDMTGLIYSEGGLKNALICNNVLTFSPGQNSNGTASIFEAPIDIRGYGNPNASNLRILNNTIYGDINSHSGSAAILVGNWPGAITIENNIVQFGTYCAYGENGAPKGLTENYNQWNCPNGFLSFGSQGPNDIPGGSSFTSNPAFVNAPTNLDLTASSPAKGAGLNMTSLGIATLDSDFASVLRPTGTNAWDIGAYDYSGQTSSAPAAPTNLVVTVQ